MARRTGMVERVKTTNDIFNDRFNGMWDNVKSGTINLSSLRNFAKMCKAIDGCDKDAFTARDLGVSGMTLSWARSCGIVKFHRTIVERTRTEYQQVDNPDKRITLVRTSKVDSFAPYKDIDYKALAEATTEYILNQIKDI